MNKNVKPTGLKGREINNRMMELMGINEDTNVTTNDNHAVKLTKKGPDGKIYAIVKENHKYFIKISKTDTNIVAESFDYIGGLGNKIKESFPSYEKATRRLAHKFAEIARGQGLYYEGNVLINDNLLSENVAFAGGAGYGFATEAEEVEAEEEMVEEVEDINGDKAPEDKETSGDNLEGDFEESPAASSTEDGIVRGQGHDKHVMEELDPVGQEDDDIDNDGDSDEEDEYLMNKRMKISKAIEEIDSIVDSVLEESDKKKS